MAGGIVALDLASATGVAAWAPGEARPRCTTVQMKDGDIGVFLSSWHNWLSGFLDLEQPEWVYYEAPWIGPSTSQTVAEKLMNLAGHTAFVARRHNCLYKPVNNAKIRKHFLALKPGEEKRDQIKTMTVLTCQKKGWAPRNDNEADALALLDWAAHERACDVPWDCKPCAGRLFAAAPKSQNKAEDRAINALANKAMRHADRGAA